MCRGVALLGIPLIDLRAEYAELREEVLAAIDDALDSMQLFLGPNVQALERDWAELCGTEHAVGVSDGTQALHLALRAMGIEPGDEIITVSWTFFATIEAIIHAGATPKLVDIEPEHFCMDPEALETAITERTRAIIPVHVYGHPADMEKLRGICAPRGIRILEDAAQAHGATDRGRMVGSIGDAGIFSFYMSKNLAGYGEGGIVTTSDDEIAHKVKMLRDHGQAERGTFECIGYNSRLDELQAAIVRVKLHRLAENTAKRRRHAALYDELLHHEEIITPQVRPGCEHVYHLYTIRSKRREEIKSALQTAEIAFATHYASPPHQQPACVAYGLDQAKLPVTEALADEVISLPMYPGLTDSQIEQVAETVLATLS
jgi:dTDP-4-amino-4,6-dideoxygalactose transaminase